MSTDSGIFWFLGITFGLTYLIEGILLASGASFEGVPVMAHQLIILGVMWVPALATVITVKWITREGFAVTNLRFGPLKPYLYTALLMPALFAVIYGLTWLTGLGQPDWQLVGFTEEMASQGADLSGMPPPRVLLPVLLVGSIVVGPTINGVFGFGEELGWRGYLLPKLMPMGKGRAYLLLGAIWGLWHAPLIVAGFDYPEHPVLGVLAMVGMTTALGVYLNELTLRYRSSILAGSIHGAFNGQAYGIWRVLFPDTNPLLGGVTGLLGIAVMTVLGLGVVKVFAGNERPVAVPDPG
jgi:hypothetical protein